MLTFGDRSRFCVEIGPPENDDPTTGGRQVDVWAADRWLTCDDNNAHVPAFTLSVEATLCSLLDLERSSRRRPFPKLSPADNLRQLQADADASEYHALLMYQFMDWGPTSDNVCAVLFREGERVFIPFSFMRPDHHDLSELGRVFVAELPERELLWVLHKTAWALARGQRWA